MSDTCLVTPIKVLDLFQPFKNSVGHFTTLKEVSVHLQLSSFRTLSNPKCHK